MTTWLPTVENPEIIDSEVAGIVGDPGSATRAELDTRYLLLAGASSAGFVRTGTGMPNSAVTAPVGTLYIDAAATNGAQVWRKASGSGNTGWVCIIGDTGWRKVLSWTGGVQDNTNQVGVIDTAVWLIPNNGDIRIRRVGDKVRFAVNVTSSNDFGFNSNTYEYLLVSDSTWPIGFRPTEVYSTFPAAHFSPPTSVAHMNSASPTRGPRFRFEGTGAKFRLYTEWVTSEGWPSSLPGVAV
jgi:hypothetical protein